MLKPKLAHLKKRKTSNRIIKKKIYDKHPRIKFYKKNLQEKLNNFKKEIKSQKSVAQLKKIQEEKLILLKNTFAALSRARDFVELDSLKKNAISEINKSHPDNINNKNDSDAKIINVKTNFKKTIQSARTIIKSATTIQIVNEVKKTQIEVVKKAALALSKARDSFGTLAKKELNKLIITKLKKDLEKISIFNIEKAIQSTRTGLPLPNFDDDFLKLLGGDIKGKIPTSTHGSSLSYISPEIPRDKDDVISIHLQKDDVKDTMEINVSVLSREFEEHIKEWKVIKSLGFHSIILNKNKLLANSLTKKELKLHESPKFNYDYEHPMLTHDGEIELKIKITRKTDGKIVEKTIVVFVEGIDQWLVDKEFERVKKTLQSKIIDKTFQASTIKSQYFGINEESDVFEYFYFHDTVVSGTNSLALTLFIIKKNSIASFKKTLDLKVNITAE